MAKELQVDAPTGLTVYAIVRSRANGQVWNGSALENYTTANYGNYDIAMTEAGTASGYYTGDFPSAITAGLYDAIYFIRAGGSPAETDTKVAIEQIQWSGTAPLSLNVIPLVTLTTTATNLTNAATNGDLTATMKASVNTEADTALSDYGALKPTTAGRTLDVSAGGEAGVDWANVGSPTTTVNLSGTTISTSQAVASVSGAVGSVTGNVGGNVTGSVGSISGITFPTNFGVLSITASTGRVDVALIEGSDATNQIRDSIVDDSTRIDASALNTLSSHDPGETIMGATDTVVLTDGSLTTAKLGTFALAKTTNITGFNDLTATQIATGVWQDATAGDFTVSSSIGKSLYTSGVAPGASGGLLIAGSNAATTFATLTVTGALTVSGGTVLNATASGVGLAIAGGSSSGHAVSITGQGRGINISTSLTGIQIASSSSTGMTIEGGGTESGMELLGGSSGGLGLKVLGRASQAAAYFAGGVDGGAGILIDGGSLGDAEGIRIRSYGTASCVTLLPQGSGTGILGNITADITGNLSGSIGSVATDGITSTSIATNAVTEIANGVWSTAVPGSFTSGTAGYVLGNGVPITGNVNVTHINGVATTSVTTVSAFLGTTAAIPFTSTRVDVSVGAMATGVVSAAAIADGAIDTATFASGTTIPRCTLVDTTSVIAGTTGTLDALQTALNSAHGAGSWATATSVTVSDKTGFKLAADGLDIITATRPAGVSTIFPQMVVSLFYREFGKVIYDANTETIKTYAANGTTVVTTQSATSSGGIDTQGEAS